MLPRGNPRRRICGREKLAEDTLKGTSNFLKDFHVLPTGSRASCDGLTLDALSCFNYLCVSHRPCSTIRMACFQKTSNGPNDFFGIWHQVHNDILQPGAWLGHKSELLQSHGVSWAKMLWHLRQSELKVRCQQVVSGAKPPHTQHHIVSI